MTIGVLFVCTGNTCRSPSAEGVLRTLAGRAGLAPVLQIDSAGTDAGRIGEAPSTEAQISARKRGYDISDRRARQVTTADLLGCDYVLAMDRSQLRHLAGMATPAEQSRLRLLLDFAPQLGLQDIPDPWHGGPADYEHALDLIETACHSLLEHLRARHFSA